MEKIIEALKYKIVQSERHGDDPNEASWGYETGVIITRNEAERILEELTKNKS